VVGDEVGDWVGDWVSTQLQQIPHDVFPSVW
jgi:hypothetical protein